MINFLVIGICLLAGWLIQVKGLLPKGSHRGINAWIIYLALPAAALKYVPAIHWNYSMLLPALMPLVIWMGAWATMKLYGEIAHLDKKTEAALIIITGLGNTSFIGFPLIQAYYGEQWLSIAAISDQVTFALLSTIAAAVAIKASGKRQSNLKTITGKLFSFPPFIAILLALVLPHFFSLLLFEPLFDKLAATIAPLALFSVGLQLQFSNFKNEIKHITVALSYKLILGPVIILLIAFVFHLTGITAKISVFEAAVGPMISAGILAEDFDLNPQLCNLVVSIGILASFATTAIWYWVMNMWF